jgi:acylphosphatase
LTTSSPVSKRFFVTGKVQGVFFRASAAREAKQLGLTGYARNLADGRVEVLACGSPERVEELANWLQHGPPMARVDRVEISVEKIQDFAGLEDFRID